MPVHMHIIALPISRVIARLIARGRRCLIRETLDGVCVSWQLPTGAMVAAFERMWPGGHAETCCYIALPCEWENNPYTVHSAGAAWNRTCSPETCEAAPATSFGAFQVAPGSWFSHQDNIDLRRETAGAAPYIRIPCNEAQIGRSCL